MNKAARDLILSELLQVCTPAPWLQDANTIYTLEHYGWRKGEEQFCNRFTASVSAGKKNEVGEVHANAKLIALAPTIAAELIKERELNAMLLEALKELLQTTEYAYRNYPNLSGQMKAGEDICRAKAVIAKTERVQL